MDNNYRPYPGKKKKRRKKALLRIGVLVLAVAVMLGMAWTFTSIIQKSGEEDMPASMPPSRPASVPQPDASGQDPVQQAVEGHSAVDEDSWNYLGLVDAARQAPQAPDYRMIALPENGRVDDSYFDTCTFVGDSITQGLQLYKTIPNAKFCAYKSIGPRSFYDGSIWANWEGVREVPMDAIAASAPRNIYVLMGVNTLVGASDEYLLEAYSGMLDAMIAAVPGANIYVQSITPVVAGKDSRFDMNRIRALNDQIAAMAWEKGLYYLDLHEAMANENGDMRPEYASSRDGYHMTSAGCDAWKEYLVTHTAYDPRNPYVEGAHYYQQLPGAEAG